MKKRICSLLAFLFITVITIFPSNVSAQDYWVYSNGNTDYYLMTETISKQYDSYDLKVKYVHKKFAPEYRTLSVNYRAMMGNRHGWMYKVWAANGSEYQKISYNNWSGAVWDYLCKHYE